MQKFLKLIDQKSTNLILLIFSDIIFFALSFLTAYLIRNELWGTQIQPLTIYLKIFPVVLIIMLFCFYYAGLYEKQKRVTPMHEFICLIKAVSAIAILVMAFSFMQKYEYSRALILLMWILSLVYIKIGRLIIRGIKNYFYKRKIGINRIAIIGSRFLGRKLFEKLKKFDVFGYEVIGYIDNEQEENDFGLKYLGKLKDLPHIIRKREINEIYFADHKLAHDEILNLIQRCENLDVKFKIASDIFEIVVGDINLNDLEGIPSIDLRKKAVAPFYDVFKRITDIVFSCLTLIIFSPFWFLIVLLIRLCYKTSAIFIQNRVGKDGKIFKMYKFRTMYENADKEALSPNAPNDPRVTMIGRFLRKFSLDEIPQLLNILKGEMSLVGPRPEMPFIVKNYRDWQKRRLEVKPGLTGLWQILGRKDLPLHENIEYDFYYIKNRSFLLDFVIILKTIGIVIKGKGAY